MKKKKNFSNDDALYLFTMILIGLHYLHSNNIVHWNLKPSNILIEKLSESLNILKIGDFCFSKIDINHLKKTVVSKTDGEIIPSYIAPEILKSESPTYKVDMWALGIILYQLVGSNDHPF